MSLFSLALLTAVYSAPYGYEDASTDFDSATELVLSKQPAQAIALFETLINANYTGADLWYNYGVSLQEAGRSLDAIVAFEKSLAFAPLADDARFNLTALRQERGLQPELPPAGWSLPRSTLTWLGWLCAALSLAACAFAFVGLGIPRMGQAAVGTSLAGGLVLAMYVAALWLAPTPRAVVVKATQLRDGPDPRLPSKETLDPGRGLEVLEERGAFLKVRTATFRVGFVMQSDLEPTL